MSAPLMTEYANMLESKLMRDAAYHTPEFYEFTALQRAQEDIELSIAKAKATGGTDAEIAVLKERWFDATVLTTAAYKRATNECRRLQSQIADAVGPLREKARQLAREVANAVQ